MNELKVGDYRLLRGTPVYISNEFKGDEGCRFGVTYVQIIDREQQPRVISGGGSFSWGAEEFSQITDPYQLAAVNAFEANRQRAEHEKAAAKASLDHEKWLGVLEVLHAGRIAQGKEPK